MRSCLITGGAGFIGSHLTDSLLAQGWRVTVVDNFDSFYSRESKEKNLDSAASSSRFSLLEADIRDPAALRRHLDGAFQAIVHLAAKAGVRPSIADPVITQDVNVTGSQALLELARQWRVPQFIFASSSSVYGVNPKVPWIEEDRLLLPISPYSSTKISGELLGHVYHCLFGIRFLALRFFTVYGPRQRPDLAIHKFARLMMEGRAIPLFGDGQSRRDYTFVDDIVAGIVAALDYDTTGYELINLGNSRTVSLLELVRSMERVSGLKAEIEWLPLQAGDVQQTFADIRKATALLGYSPKTSLDSGLRKFWAWLEQGKSVVAPAYR